VANIIDELIVKLGLDSKDIDSKAPAATKKLKELDEGAAAVGKSSKAAAAGLSEFAGKLGAFLALLGGTVALKQFIRDTIDTNTQIALLSKNLGISAQSIFAWSIASQELGGTASGVQGTLRMLSQESSNLAFLGESRLIPFFAKMRIALAGPNGPRNPTDILRDLATYSQNALNMGASRASIHNWLSMFIPDQGTINLILQGTAAIDQAQARARKWAPSNAEVNSALAMKQALTDLGAQFTKIGYDLLQAATPALEDFFRKMRDIGSWLQSNEGLVKIIAEATIGVAAFGAAFVLVTSPIALVVAGITALASAILLLIDDYKTWSKGGISEFDWSGFAKAVREAGNAFEWLGDRIASATDRYDKWVESHPSLHKFLPTSKDAKGIATVLMGYAMSWEFPGIKLVPANVQKLAAGIEEAEGFNRAGSIPQKANNPGDIEYGKFAIAHGATGSITAKGGKQIAVFPDVATGLSALYALLEANYVGMDFQSALSKYTGLPKGSAALSGYSAAVAQAGGISPAPVAANNSKTINIANMNVHTQATDAKGIFESVHRGTDFLTWGAPANGASQ
jgi:hypothetical protein